MDCKTFCIEQLASICVKFAEGFEWLKLLLSCALSAHIHDVYSLWLICRVIGQGMRQGIIFLGDASRPSFIQQSLEHLKILLISKQFRHVLRFDTADGGHSAGGILSPSPPLFPINQGLLLLRRFFVKRRCGHWRI